MVAWTTGVVSRTLTVPAYQSALIVAGGVESTRSPATAWPVALRKRIQTLTCAFSSRASSCRRRDGAGAHQTETTISTAAGNCERVRAVNESMRLCAEKVAHATSSVALYAMVLP